MILHGRLLALASFALFAGGTAFADDFTTCTTGSLYTAATEACSRIIENASETPTRKALGHAKIASTKISHFEAEDFTNDFNNGVLDKIWGTTRTERAERTVRPALEHINRAIALDPRNAQHYGIRAQAYKALGKNDEALADYATALESFFEQDGRPDTFGLGLLAPIALTQRQDLWLQLRDFDKVIAETSTLIANYPEALLQYGQRARAYVGKNEYDLAIADYTSVLRQLEAPGKTRLPAFRLAERYVDRAKVYEKKGDRDHAIKDYRQALRIDGKSYAARDGLKRFEAQ
jgi:tetratricopeptide (TPR) repeat protein